MEHAGGRVHSGLAGLRIADGAGPRADEGADARLRWCSARRCRRRRSARNASGRRRAGAGGAASAAHNRQRPTPAASGDESARRARSTELVVVTLQEELPPGQGSEGGAADSVGAPTLQPAPAVTAPTAPLRKSLAQTYNAAPCLMAPLAPVGAAAVRAALRPGSEPHADLHGQRRGRDRSAGGLRVLSRRSALRRMEIVTSIAATISSASAVTCTSARCCRPAAEVAKRKSCGAGLKADKAVKETQLRRAPTAALHEDDRERTRPSPRRPPPRSDDSIA